MRRPVVARSAPQKPYQPAPVQDSKRCGFGGLLSRPAVHAASRDEEERSSIAVLGNVVISKNFLQTRKIMVMHSNEREEYCPRTLVDRKWKRYDNAVDVVVCLHDRPILVPKV